MSKVGSLETLSLVIRELRRVIYKLTFTDNFMGFTWTGDIGVGSEIFIPNPLGSVPSGFIVLDGKGTRDITRSSISAWSTSAVYLYNGTAALAEGVVVRFFK